jgi:hypothetical protein
LFALSGVFLIVLVVTGLWATRATDLMDVVEQNDQVATSTASVMSLEQMTAGADVIAIGTCTETRSQWFGRQLFTLATVSLKETLKGDTDETLTVALPGGVDANREFPIAMTFAGAPQMSAGDEAFLFLTRDGDMENVFAVMGFAQGKFPINQDAGGEKVVMQDTIKASVPKGIGVMRGNLQAIPLEEFRARVMNLLR